MAIAHSETTHQFTDHSCPWKHTQISGAAAGAHTLATQGQRSGSAHGLHAALSTPPSRIRQRHEAGNIGLGRRRAVRGKAKRDREKSKQFHLQMKVLGDDFNYYLDSQPDPDIVPGDAGETHGHHGSPRGPREGPQLAQRWHRALTEAVQDKEFSPSLRMNLIPHAESRGGALSKTSRGLTAVRATEPVLCSMHEFGGQSGEKAKLQGSLKRKLVVNLSPVNNKRPNGVSDNSFLDIKRLRVGDNIPMGQGGHHANNCQSQSMSGTMPVGQGSQRKTSNLANNAHASGNGMFNMTLKEVKKEPGETMSCSKHLDGQMSHENMFPNRYGEDSGEQMMDPELQELFNELTNISVPPMSDLELENMINATIKQDEPFNIDLGQQSQRGPVRSLQMDKMVIKSEYAPGMNQASVGSPQMRPSSTGPAFTMATAAMSTSSPIPSVPQNQTQVSQVSSASSRPLPNWQEVSHAQQLKQIAANRQQHALIQQQQQQQNQTANWSTLSPSGPSPGPFVQEKIPSPSFRQQQFSPQSSAMLGVPVNGNQSKGMNNYVYKPTTPQSNPMDIIMQQKPQDLNRNFINSAQPPLEQHHGNTKPLFHFNSEQTNQQMPSVLGSQSKPALLHYTQQSQSSAPVQQPQQQQQPQPQPAQPLPNQSLQRPPNVPLPMQQKMMLQKIQQSQQISGLQYPVSQQHRQVTAVSLDSVYPEVMFLAYTNKAPLPKQPVEKGREQQEDWLRPREPAKELGCEEQLERPDSTRHTGVKESPPLHEHQGEPGCLDWAPNFLTAPSNPPENCHRQQCPQRGSEQQLHPVVGMLALRMARLKSEAGELHLALLPLGPEVLRARRIPGEATLLPLLVPQPQPPISAGIRCHQRGTKRSSSTACPRAATRGFNQCVETQVRAHEALKTSAPYRVFAQVH
ncbi:Mastermind-like protein 2 [Aix galericulata]|nr:Mastermind-like protein 2 [Aix galericulata]